MTDKWNDLMESGEWEEGRTKSSEEMDEKGYSKGQTELNIGSGGRYVSSKEYLPLLIPIYSPDDLIGEEDETEDNHICPEPMKHPPTNLRIEEQVLDFEWNNPVGDRGGNYMGDVNVNNIEWGIMYT